MSCSTREAKLPLEICHVLIFRAMSVINGQGNRVAIADPDVACWFWLVYACSQNNSAESRQEDERQTTYGFWATKLVVAHYWANGSWWAIGSHSGVQG